MTGYFISYAVASPSGEGAMIEEAQASFTQNPPRSAMNAKVFL
jgi:hypothetical protein